MNTMPSFIFLLPYDLATTHITSFDVSAVFARSIPALLLLSSSPTAHGSPFGEHFAVGDDVEVAATWLHRCEVAWRVRQVTACVDGVGVNGCED
jgi:hypothetical protein